MKATVKTSVHVGEISRHITCDIQTNPYSDEPEKMHILRFMEEDIQSEASASISNFEIWKHEKESPSAIIRHCAKLLVELADRIDSKPA